MSIQSKILVIMYYLKDFLWGLTQNIVTMHIMHSQNSSLWLTLCI